MKAWIDLDGVMCDFVGGAKRIHGKEDIELPLGEWDIAPYFGLPNGAFWKPIDRSFWESLSMMPDAMEILGIIEESVGYKNCCLLSSPNKNVDCVSGKIAWIKANLPSYWANNKYCICANKEMLAYPGSLLIDDYNINIQRFFMAGGMGL